MQQEKQYRSHVDSKGFNRNKESGIIEFLRSIYPDNCPNINYRHFDEEGYFYEDSDEEIESIYKLPKDHPLFIKYKMKKIKTDRLYDEDGFDINGYYWKKKADGTREKTDSLYNEEGYDVNGFNQKGIHRVTKLPYDERYFDKDGINIYTEDIYDIMGFNINGIIFSGNYYTDNLRIYDGLELFSGNYVVPTIIIGKQEYTCEEISKRVIKAIKDDKLELFISTFADNHAMSKKEMKEKINNALIYNITINPSFKTQLFFVINEIKDKIKLNRTMLKQLEKYVDDNEDEIERIKKEINKSTSIISSLSPSLRG